MTYLEQKIRYICHKSTAHQNIIAAYLALFAAVAHIHAARAQVELLLRWLLLATSCTVHRAQPSYLASSVTVQALYGGQTLMHIANGWKGLPI